MSVTDGPPGPAPWMEGVCEQMTFSVCEDSDGAWHPVTTIWTRNLEGGEDMGVCLVMSAQPSREDAELWCLTHGEGFAAHLNERHPGVAHIAHLVEPINDGSN